MKIVEVKAEGRLRSLASDNPEEYLWVDLACYGTGGWLLEALSRQDPTIGKRIRDRGLKVKMTLEILDD